MSKKMNSIARFKHYDTLLSCPICHTAMSITDSAICEQGHNFDFSKQGYLNLLVQNNATHYDKELFESRRELITESAFFTPLLERLTTIINTYHQTKPLTLVDGGCGEGSHVAYLKETLGDKLAIAFGTDIAKEGILSAAKHYPTVSWLVADLANMPFASQTIDIILNILSPANYKEFDRMLTQEGCVIKIVPQSNYLKELRHYFFADTTKADYSNDDTVALFEGQFPDFTRETINYTTQLNAQQLSHLLHMTPLTWNLEEDLIQQFITKSDGIITADFEILIGKK